MALLNLAVVFVAFGCRFLKHWYSQVGTERVLQIGTYIEEAMEAQSNGGSKEPPQFLQLAEDELLRRMSAADDQEAVRLQVIYRTWGLAKRRLRWLIRGNALEQSESALVIARMRLHDGLPLIISLLKSHSRQVHLSALRALEELAAPEAAAALVAILPAVKNSSWPLALAALITSCRNRPDLLPPYLAHSDPRIRSLVASALAKIASPELLVSLQPYCEDPEPEVRAKIALALGTTGDRRAFSLLKNMVRDSVPLVRVEAVTALGKLGDYEALETLITAAQDSNWLVRRSAAAALYNLGSDPIRRLAVLHNTGDRYAAEAMVAELERRGEVWSAINELDSPIPEIRIRNRLLIEQLVKIRAYASVLFAIEMHPSERIRQVLLEIVERVLSTKERVDLVRLLDSPYLDPSTRHLIETLVRTPE